MTMNKLVMMILVGGLALAGCGGGKKGDTTMSGGGDTTGGGGDMAGSGDATTPPAEGPPCTQEIALECPEGQIDACLKTPPEGETHTCVPQ